MEESGIKKLIEHLSVFQIVLFFIIIGFLYYMSHITFPVPNLINSTNKTFQVLYTTNDLVPPTFIPLSYALFGMGLVFVFGLSFLLDKQKEGRRITEQEAKDFVVSEFENKRKIKMLNGKFEADNYEIDKILSVITPTRYEGSKRVPKYICLGLVLINKHNLPEFWKVRVNAYELLIEDITETTEEMVDKDKCSKCGDEFDEKPILAEDLYRLKQAGKYMKDT